MILTARRSQEGGRPHQSTGASPEGGGAPGGAFFDDADSGGASPAQTFTNFARCTTRAPEIARRTPCRAAAGRSGVFAPTGRLAWVMRSLTPAVSRVLRGACVTHDTAEVYVASAADMESRLRQTVAAGDVESRIAPATTDAMLTVTDTLLCDRLQCSHSKSLLDFRELACQRDDYHDTQCVV